MSPLGKFTLAILGLRFGGATGFFWGMFLGQVLIDSSWVIRKIESAVSQLDDNIRLLLPYNISRYYNRIEGNFWGKIWGGSLGLVTYGFYGFLILFAIGHFLFDTPRSAHANHFRQRVDAFWKTNLGKILGGIIGFSLHSHWLLFAGVVLGSIWDLKLYAGKLKFPKLRLPVFFWSGNYYLKAVAGLAAKISKADGVVSAAEIKLFKTIFAVADKDHSQISKVFNDAKESVSGYERYARELGKLVSGDLSRQEKIMESLLQIAWVDGQVSDDEHEMLSKIAEIIGLPEGNFKVIEKSFEPRVMQTGNVGDFYDLLGVMRNASDVEIKKRWRELINEYHPDRVQASGATVAEVEASSQKMAEINSAYESLMKSRKIA